MTALVDWWLRRNWRGRNEAQMIIEDAATAI